MVSTSEYRHVPVAYHGRRERARRAVSHLTYNDFRSPVSPGAAALPPACASSALHEDQYVSLEIERHPEFAKEVQAQEAVNRCAEWFEVGEIHDAGSEPESPSGAYADRIHPDELEATGSFHTGPDSDHAASGWQPETLDEIPVHTGHRRAGIENEIPGPLAVHVYRDGEGGIIGAHECHGDLSGERIRRGFHLHPLFEGTPVEHEDQREDSQAPDASDFAHTELGLQLSIPLRCNPRDETQFAGSAYQGYGSRPAHTHPPRTR
jgi:hypothetical protein